MAEGNGTGDVNVAQMIVEVAASAAHSLPTTFRIGGKDVRVPALTLWTLETREAEMDAISVGGTVREYTNTVLLIIATSIECERAGEERDPDLEAIQSTFRRFKRVITFGEMRDLAVSMNQLLLNSGYTLSGEAEAAKTEVSPGTGTSTESPPNSPSGESATAIPEESSVH